MSRPRLLDLFCGAGGCSVGYYEAGFDVVGVDIKRQPRHPGHSLFYPGMEFVQADALEYLAAHGQEFDAIHASPPCQAFCSLKHLANQKEHPNLIPQTRDLLIAAGVPYVIENVPGAPLVEPSMLCGTMFGLQTECGAELRRHRLFETSCPLVVDLKCNHYASARPCTDTVHGHSGGSSRRDGTGPVVISITGNTPEGRKGSSKKFPGDKVQTISVHGDHARKGNACAERIRTIGITGTGQALSGGRTISVCGHSSPAFDRGKTISITGSTPQQNVVRNLVRECFPVSAARVAMGIDWMVMAELSQAIPPAYTEYIGRRLIEALR